MEERSSSRGLGKHRANAIIAAILSLCLMGMLLCQGVQKAQAASLDLTRDCTISIALADDEPMPTGLRYDLYKVAGVEAQTGYDAYDFIANGSGPFANLPISSLNDEPSAADYKAVANEAADIIVTENVLAGISNVPATATQTVSPGLYLIVPYSPDATEGDNVLTKQGDNYVSFAYSDTQRYTFSPELFALPSKVPDTAQASNSTDAGDWLTNVTVTLKPTVTDHAGTVVVQKTIDVFFASSQRSAMGSNGETFIYQLAGYSSQAAYNGGNPLEAPVYTDVVSLMFNGAGTQSVTLYNVPVGVYMVATEVYAGASYESRNAVEVGTVSANPANILVLPFDSSTSPYIGMGKRGGSVTNSFDYIQDDPSDPNTWRWNWTQTYNGEPVQQQGGDVE